MSNESFFRIDQVAERTGLTKRTLRYYEEIGLLDPPTRTEGNYRLYTEADIARLDYISQLKKTLGLSLAEINMMIHTEEERAEIRSALKHEHDASARLEQIVRVEELTQQQLALVDVKLESLTRLRAELEERLLRCREGRAQITRESS